jgi:hypothetical protein
MTICFTLVLRNRKDYSGFFFDEDHERVPYIIAVMWIPGPAIPGLFGQVVSGSGIIAQVSDPDLTCLARKSV